MVGNNWGGEMGGKDGGRGCGYKCITPTKLTQNTRHGPHQRNWVGEGGE